MPKKLTNDQIVKRIYELVGGDYTKLDNVYLGNKGKFPIKHNICSHTYEVNWSNFKSGFRCPKCFGTALLSDHGVAKEIKRLTQGEYEKLTPYINAKTKFSIMHNLCGAIYDVNWNNFKSGYRCPRCAERDRHFSQAFTDEHITEQLAALVGDEYTKLSAYFNSATPFKIRHNVCGHSYNVNWSNFSVGKRCPECMGAKKLTNEKIIKRIYDLVGNEYTKLDDFYTNHHSKFPIKHTECGHEYEVSWSNFQRGKRCPKCKESKREKSTSIFLENNSIPHKRQYVFNDCRNINPLPFDFALLDDYSNLILLIEIDGRQHYEPVSFFGGDDGFKRNQINDQIKNDYCLANNIPLFRIRYDEDIHKRLDEIFSSDVYLSKRTQPKFGQLELF